MTISTADLANELIRYANLAVDNGELSGEQSGEILTIAADLITNNVYQRERVKNEASLICNRTKGYAMQAAGPFPGLEA
jgi:hypothetical protein